MSDAPALDFLPPEWFTRALAAPCESRYVDAGGTAIHYLAWNEHDTHKPGLVFALAFARTPAGGVSSRRSWSNGSAWPPSISPAWAIAATAMSTRKRTTRATCWQ